MDTVRLSTLATLAICLAVLGALWFLSDGFAAGRAHDAAEDRWDAREPASYAFDYSHCGGMCAQCTLRITVTDGRVSDVVRRDSTCSDYEAGNAPTIDEVFDLVDADRTAMHTESATITYDPEWGFPASASTSCGEGTADCGSGYAVSDFEVLADR